jgi:hypothetical protein
MITAILVISIVSIILNILCIILIMSMMFAIGSRIKFLIENQSDSIKAVSQIITILSFLNKILKRYEKNISVWYNTTTGDTWKINNEDKAEYDKMMERIKTFIAEKTDQ